MGNLPVSDEKPIKDSWRSEADLKVIAALKVMTAGKYEIRGVLGSTINGDHPYIFDRKGDLTKIKKRLEITQRKIEAVMQNFAELDKAGLLDTLDSGIRARVRGMPVESAYDLICDNCIKAGAARIAVEMMGVLSSEIDEYKTKIAEAEAKWPKNRNKARAMHVADEIAEVYVSHLGKKPSYGTEGHKDDAGQSKKWASTDFSRAVHEIFSILKVDGNPDEAAMHSAQKYTDKTAAEAQQEMQKMKHPFLSF